MQDQQGDTKLLRRALIGVLAAATVFVAVFAFRTVASFVYWNDEAHQFQPIAGWMTPRYVSKSWKVPPEIVADALGRPIEQGTGRTSLDEIAEARGEPVEAIIAALNAAIAAHEATRP